MLKPRALKQLDHNVRLKNTAVSIRGHAVELRKHEVQQFGGSISGSRTLLASKVQLGLQALRHLPWRQPGLRKKAKWGEAVLRLAHGFNTL